MLWESWQAVMDQQDLPRWAAWEIQPVLPYCWHPPDSVPWEQRTTKHRADCNSTSHSNVLAAILPEFSNILSGNLYMKWHCSDVLRKWSLSVCKPAGRTAKRLYDQHCNVNFWSLLSFLQDPQHSPGWAKGCSLARSVLGYHSWRVIEKVVLTYLACWQSARVETRVIGVDQLIPLEEESLQKEEVSVLHVCKSLGLQTVYNCP